MPCLHAKLIGRFGNLCFQYAHCKAWCVQNGWTLQADPWIGERIFQIEDERPHPKPDRVFSGYAQDQDSLIYTRKQCKEWFRFRPELAWHAFANMKFWPLLGHRRLGDYGALGYVIVSMESYYRACKQFNLDEKSTLSFVSEEQPHGTVSLPEFPFLEDFYRMMNCKVLLRGNSSFSWWAATLGTCEVYSPVIDGKEGGHVERDCEFVKGNWPRFANLPFVTDLHLKDE